MSSGAFESLTDFDSVCQIEELEPFAEFKVYPVDTFNYCVLSSDTVVANPDLSFGGRLSYSLELPVCHLRKRPRQREHPGRLRAV